MIASLLTSVRNRFGTPPGRPTPRTIRRLVGRMERLVAGEENQRRMDVQRRLNRLEVVRPTPFNSFSWGAFFPTAINAWSQRLRRPMDVERIARATGPLDSDYAARLVEFQLLQKLEAFRLSNDDIPVSPVIHTNLGLCRLYRPSPVGERFRHVPETGDFAADPILTTEADFDRLEIPHYRYDRPLHEERLTVFEEIVEGRLPVVDDGLPGGIAAPFQTACNLRGMLQILEDFAAQPHLVHRLMDYVARSIVTYVGELKAAQANDTPNPSPFGCDGLFGCDEVSCSMFKPSCYDEFIYPYECRAAAAYDTVYYHSCANITPLFEKIVTIPKIRRLQVSPASDLRTAIDVTRGAVILERWIDPYLALDEMSREEMVALVRQTSDLGVEYPLDMRVDTSTLGGQRFRAVFHETAAGA